MKGERTHSTVWDANGVNRMLCVKPVCDPPVSDGGLRTPPNGSAPVHHRGIVGPAWCVAASAPRRAYHKSCGEVDAGVKPTQRGERRAPGAAIRAGRAWKARASTRLGREGAGVSDECAGRRDGYATVPSQRLKSVGTGSPSIANQTEFDCDHHYLGSVPVDTAVGDSSAYDRVTGRRRPWCSWCPCPCLVPQWPLLDGTGAGTGAGTVDYV